MNFKQGQNLIDISDLPRLNAEWDKILLSIPEKKALVITKDKETQAHSIRMTIKKIIKRDQRFSNYIVTTRKNIAYIANLGDKS